MTSYTIFLKLLDNEAIAHAYLLLCRWHLKCTAEQKSWRTERWYASARRRQTIPQKQISIVNPTHKGTTGHRAAWSLVDRGHAAWVIVGVSIRLMDSLLKMHQRQESVMEYESRMATESTNKGIREHRGGVVFWNGSPKPLYQKMLTPSRGRGGTDGPAMHRPGEVIS